MENILEVDCSAAVNVDSASTRREHLSIIGAVCVGLMNSTVSDIRVPPVDGMYVVKHR